MDSLMPRSDVAELTSRVAAIDLDRVKRKLMKDEGWTEAEADTATGRYRRFLVMGLLKPDFHLVPARDIDKVWHQHILHTRLYAADCETLFGRFMHHNPGSSDTVEMEHLRDNLERTKAFYRETFGEEYIDTWLTFFLS